MLPIINEKEHQKLVFPQEMDVWYVLPAIRREFARALLAQGLSQKQVAPLLGVTEASVSHYKKEKRARELVFDEHTKFLIKNAAVRVVAQPQSIFGEIMAIDDELKRNGVFCQLHKSKSWTPGGCEQVCGQHFFVGGLHG